MTTIIPIRASEDPESSGEVEWVMLELNGELLKPLDEPRRIPQANLLPDCTAVDDVRRRVELGSLKFDADGAPTLIIGNHELKGSAITLKEPFAVLRKRKVERISQNCNAGVTSESASKSRRKVHLEVVGVVKKKLMFDRYPKSIMRST